MGTVYHRQCFTLKIALKYGMATILWFKTSSI